jgi:hypothetical protein
MDALYTLLCVGHHKDGAEEDKHNQRAQLMPCHSLPLLAFY